MLPIHVPRNVGMNPVAQAVFRAKFKAYMLDTKIRVLLLDQGEACMDLIQSASYVLTVMGHACELQGIDDVDTRILRGGLSALVQLSAAGLWDKGQAVAVERALNSAEVLLPRVKPLMISRSINQMAAIEQRD